MSWGAFKKLKYQCHKAVLRDSDTIGLGWDKAVVFFKKKLLR